MNVYDINPFIRFAECIRYTSEENWVMVQDCRIFYVLAGRAELYMPDLHYSLIPGSLFYCHADNCYNLVSDGIECICLNFDLTQEDNVHTAIYPRISITNAAQTFHRTTPKDTCLADDDFLPSHLFIANAAEYLNALNTILKEFDMQKIYYKEACGGILKTLLTNLYRHSLRSTDNSADAVSKVLDYIKSNFDKPITNQQLSEITSYHENHLNRLFSNHTGTTIHKYILTIRINEAKKLLLNTNLALLTIAEKTGFNSNAYFSNYFKQVEGISPLQYRKKFQNRI
ncbi:MAG: helix-turn-helix transcriptional regulator [Lachnospiraceae bacterium]|nr:helix-turn-helix transcriptional regulator [Lachnospiraceae bacterium]